MRTLKRLALGLLAAVGLGLVLHPAAVAQTVGCGGAFVPTFNCLIQGLWDFTPQNSTTAYDVPFKANGSEATGVVSKVVDLTNAQVLALNKTGVSVIAAPGIGKSIDVIGVTLIFNRTGAYTSAQNVRLFYGSRTSGNAASAVITGVAFFDAGASISIRVAGTPDNTNPSVSNQAVVIVQATTAAAMGGGNAANTVRVVVHYRIIATSLTT